MKKEITNFHKLLKEITNDAKLSFNVPDRISNPDKVITEAKNNFEFQRSKNNQSTESSYKDYFWLFRH